VPPFGQARPPRAQNRPVAVTVCGEGDPPRRSHRGRVTATPSGETTQPAPYSRRPETADDTLCGSAPASFGHQPQSGPEAPARRDANVRLCLICRRSLGTFVDTSHALARSGHATIPNHPPPALKRESRLPVLEIHLDARRYFRIAAGEDTVDVERDHARENPVVRASSADSRTMSCGRCRDAGRVSPAVGDPLGERMDQYASCR